MRYDMRILVTRQVKSSSHLVKSSSLSSHSHNETTVLTDCRIVYTVNNHLLDAGCLESFLFLKISRNLRGGSRGGEGTGKTDDNDVLSSAVIGDIDLLHIGESLHDLDGGEGGEGGGGHFGKGCECECEGAFGFGFGCSEEGCCQPVCDEWSGEFCGCEH